jgi:argininosuccinate lyase
MTGELATGVYPHPASRSNKPPEVPVMLHNDHLAYTVSLHYDRRLYKHDITGSTAHVRMLAKQGILPQADADLIADGLVQVRDEIEAGNFPWRDELEDIHMNIERRLFDKIGDVAGKLHTARSRNDQVSTDMRLYTKEAIRELVGGVHDLRQAIVGKAGDHTTTIMPGYTHVQRAQPVYFAHHMLAYFEMLDRDRERLVQAQSRADVMPLGSGALAGVPYPIDREMVARELGFASISANSMDAVSDRDFVLDLLSAASTCMMHLSRLAEELVLWSSEEFGFIRLHNDYTTGSSMMPQKRNPDFAELARGKTGRVFGHLVAMLTVMKGLPMTYDRDMQEDKEALFDTVDVLQSTLAVMTGMVSTLDLNVERLREAAEGGNSLATDIADYLVIRGMPFREAHGVVAALSEQAGDEGKKLNELSLDAYRNHSTLFDESVRSINVTTSLEARNVPGGTASGRVASAVQAARETLEAENG